MFYNLCKCFPGKLVKILPAGLSNPTSFDTDTLSISNITSPKELDEYVMLESHMYQIIFGETKLSASSSRKRLSIVRISYGGKSIHRAFRAATAKGFGKEYVALTPSSIYELSQGSEIPSLSELTIGKGCRWLYYWNHPNAAVRMSFKIGIIGICFTIILSFKDELFCLLSNLLNY